MYTVRKKGKRFCEDGEYGSCKLGVNNKILQCKGRK